MNRKVESKAYKECDKNASTTFCIDYEVYSLSFNSFVTLTPYRDIYFLSDVELLKFSVQNASCVFYIYLLIN